MCDHLISINKDMINIIRSYLLPTIEELEDLKSDCEFQLVEKTTYLRYCLNKNTCLDNNATTIFYDLKNSKIKYIGLGKQTYWSIRKLG